MNIPRFPGRAALAAALCAALSGCVFATGHGGHAPRDVLEGTWISTVSGAPNAPGPFLTISTYIPTGQSLTESVTPQLITAQHGQWWRTGHRSFKRILTFVSYADPAHTTYNGIIRAYADIALDPDGESFTASNRFEFYDPAGKLVFSGTNTEQARRCGPATRIPVCLGLEPVPKQ